MDDLYEGSQSGFDPIERVDVRRLALPTGIRSFVLPNGHRTPTDLSALLVRVTDSEGGSGTSLLWAQRGEHLELIQSALHYLSDVVVRCSGDIRATVAAMRDAVAFLGTEGVTAFAISGYEMAITDLICRRRGLNLADALGRKHERIRAYQTGLMLPQSIDELVHEAGTIVERGIFAIKMIVGMPTVDDDVARVGAVRASLPDGAILMVDALQRWTVDQALDATQRLAEFDLTWVEDPIPHSDLAGYARLVRDSPIKISTGETCFATSAFERLLEMGVPYVIAELERVGGISGWMNIARLAADGQAVTLPHIYPHISAQLVAALPQQETWWEYVPWFDQLVDDPFDIADGFLTPSRSVGSGFDPSPEAIERCASGQWTVLKETAGSSRPT